MYAPIYWDPCTLYISTCICPAQSRPAHSLGKSMLDVTDYCVHVAAVAAVVDVAVAAAAAAVDVAAAGGC